ncbi:MAG: DinB family protein [Thermomicrobiales bacterium]
MAAESTETVATKKKAELIAGIDQTWATLEAALAATSEEMSTTVGRDGWSVKDHLAHIEGWERFLLAVLARQSPSGAIGIDLGTLRSTDDDTLNELLVGPTRAQSLAQVMGNLRQTRQRLLAVVAALPDADLERLAAEYQPEELDGDTDSIAGWVYHICDEHLQDHIGWIKEISSSS